MNEGRNIGWPLTSLRERMWGHSRRFSSCPFPMRNHTSRFVSRPYNPTPKCRQRKDAPLIHGGSRSEDHDHLFNPREGRVIRVNLPLTAAGGEQHTSSLVFLFLSPLWAPPAKSTGFTHVLWLCCLCLPPSSSTIWNELLSNIKQCFVTAWLELDC